MSEPPPLYFILGEVMFIRNPQWMEDYAMSTQENNAVSNKLSH